MLHCFALSSSCGCFRGMFTGYYSFVALNTVLHVLQHFNESVCGGWEIIILLLLSAVTLSVNTSVPILLAAKYVITPPLLCLTNNVKFFRSLPIVQAQVNLGFMCCEKIEMMLKWFMQYFLSSVKGKILHLASFFQFKIRCCDVLRQHCLNTYFGAEILKLTCFFLPFDFIAK